MGNRGRYAIVTPYFNEGRHLIEHCIRSVRAQTLTADHILVADGHPQAWIDSELVRHLKLDRNHANYGNTPRSLGALLAASEGYDGIGLLDADNWLEPDHVACCVDAAGRVENCDYVIARRNICRPDGSIFPIEDEGNERHVDTNCFFLLPGSYHVLPVFALMPDEVAPLCDRMFYMALQAKDLIAIRLQQKTVNYRSLWQYAYEKAGEPAPPNAKPAVDVERIRDWRGVRTPRQMEIFFRRSGFRFDIR